MLRRDLWLLLCPSSVSLCLCVCLSLFLPSVSTLSIESVYSRGLLKHFIFFLCSLFISRSVLSFIPLLALSNVYICVHVCEDLLLVKGRSHLQNTFQQWQYSVRRTRQSRRDLANIFFFIIMECTISLILHRCHTYNVAKYLKTSVWYVYICM